MDEKKFLKNYFIKLSSLLEPDNQTKLKLIKVKNLINAAKKKGKKILIFGNGGSAAIASHFSVDLTKNAKVKCVNFNESDLITCFSNDYGYENWMKKSIEFYGEKGDILIVISSSGNSKNIHNAIKMARKKRFSSLITFSGFKKNNPLKNKGNINFWVKSKSYNFVENIHQAWLLSIVDLIVAKKL